MATYTAEIKIKNPGNYFTVTVEAGATYEAKEIINHIYNPVTIRNLRQVSGRSKGGSGSSGDGTGGVVLIGLFIAAWLLYTFAPFIVMGVGGFLGAWIGEKITGQSLDDYHEIDEPTNGETGRLVILLLLSLSLGGWGFVQGTLWQKEMNTDTTPKAPKTEQVKTK